MLISAMRSSVKGKRGELARGIRCSLGIRGKKIYEMVLVKPVKNTVQNTNVSPLNSMTRCGINILAVAICDSLDEIKGVRDIANRLRGQWDYDPTTQSVRRISDRRQGESLNV